MGIDDQLESRILQVVRDEFPTIDPLGGFGLHDYLHACGRGSHALLCVALFCPPLVEVDGSVLLRWSVESESGKSRFLEYRIEKGHAAAEQSFNFVEIPYVFGSNSDISEDSFHVLAEAVAASWRAWISSKFPGRHFDVDVLEPEETGSVVGIQFCERRRAGHPSEERRDREVGGKE